MWRNDQAALGLSFAARGIDAASLGMKVGEKRPDLLILDDIEPDESSYSAYQTRIRKTSANARSSMRFSP